MEWHTYPDPGGIASDRERIQFAVGFATAQRARSARRIYDAASEPQPLDDLLFLAIDAFEEKMHVTEDTLGWLSALTRWIPDGRNLFPLLDSVRVERKEGRLIELLERLDEDGLRQILRARREDLEAAGPPQITRQRIDGSIPALLAGLRRVLDFRAANDRRTVIMFNKSKHMLQASLFRGRDGTHAVEFITGSPVTRVGVSS